MYLHNAIYYTAIIIEQFGHRNTAKMALFVYGDVSLAGSLILIF